MKTETNAKFKELAFGLREEIRTAIMSGTVYDMENRLDAVLDGFVGKLITLCDDEAVKRAKLYVDGFTDARLLPDESS